MSFSASHSGHKLTSTREEWTEEEEKKHELGPYDIKPCESVYIWQFVSGMRDTEVLLSRHLTITETREPPLGPP